MNIPSGKIEVLVRLPNWLGDLVMSSAAIRALQQQLPEAHIDVIVKQELQPIAALIPGVRNIYPFSKQEYKGLTGAKKFGREIRSKLQYDLFFTFPNSFSSAVMAWATGAKRRVGFRGEMRALFLSKAFSKPNHLHRAEEYLHLVDRVFPNLSDNPAVRLEIDPQKVEGLSTSYIVFNFNSEADSRRMPVDKAISILDEASQHFDQQLVLVGSPKEKEHIDSILSGVKEPEKFLNLAGKTRLPGLAAALKGADLVVSTDSGPAHLANALTTPVLVFFGAGDEKNTAPYNQENLIIFRFPGLDCAPCVSNNCKFGIPRCLVNLDNQSIIQKMKQMISAGRGDP